jgi:enoyl-CoA hydratase/carnithine racemase
MAMVLSERDGAVALLTLNNPAQYNALGMELLRDFAAALEQAIADPAVRVILLTGAGKGFCSGADLVAQDMPRGTGGRLEHMRGVGRSAAALRDIGKPTIAKVNGVAAGAGLNLALGCDLVIASDAARFSAIFVQRGLSVDYGGSWLLPRLIGMHKAKELAFLADMIDAAEAERIGIVNRIAPADELDTAVDTIVARLLQMAPIALTQTKHLLDQAFTVTFAEAVEAEAAAQVVNLSSDDAKEAVRAFMEKRNPSFTGE